MIDWVKKIFFGLVALVFALKIVPKLIVVLFPMISDGLNNFSAAINTYVPGLGDILSPDIVLTLAVLLLAIGVFVLVINKVEHTGGHGGGGRM